MNSRIAHRLGLSVVVSLAFGASRASADFITFNLDTGNSAIGGYTGPYGTVTVTRTSTTTATIELDSLANGNFTYLFGGQGTLGLNVNATSFSASNIHGFQANNALFTGWNLDSTGSGNEDGFGSFNFTIQNHDGFADSVNKMTLTLTNTSGTWASASDVLAPNANGGRAGGHVFVWDTTGGVSSSGLYNPTTGYAAGSGTGTPPLNTPVPPSIVVFGLGSLCFAGLTAVQRRRSATVAG
jgi:hypothetical protein